ncbi:MAG: hypothetical protein J6Q73_00560 [Bacteroidaceae bacterium]|nr:hypothetical protein [Bacteroidaceae bacterium]
MKRITFFIATLCLLQVNVNAQTLEKVQSILQIPMSIPAEYTVTGKAKLIYGTVNEDETMCILGFYNNDLSRGREIEFTNMDVEYIVDLDYVDFDHNSVNLEMVFTETLFNNDDKVEYVREVRDEIYVEEWESYTQVTKRIEIVNEDGQVLFTIEPGVVGAQVETQVGAFRWNNKDYLFVDSYSWGDSSEEICDVYAINKGEGESGISKVKTLPAMSASPVFAKKHSFVDVTIDEATAAAGGELVVVDNSGRIITKQSFAPGQTKVPVSTDRMRTGVYNITFNNGEKIDNARIIVK